MNDLPDPSSFWVASTARPPRAPLTGDIVSDACVIGGGILGILTAHLLQTEGRSVVLLEADQLAGRGVTGNTTAKITSSHGLIYSKLERGFGRDGARIYGEANEAGKELIAQIVDELDIGCDFERQDNYVYTDQATKIAALREEIAAARRADLPASFVTSSPLPYPIEGAVRFEHQAQFHPRRFVLGLADGLEAAGTQIFEGTRATGLDAGETARIQTKNGATVSARHVVVATHLPFLDRGFFFAKAHPYRSYVVAGHVADAPDGMHISTGGSTRSVRRTPDGDRSLLIIGGESHKTGQKADTEEPYGKLVAFAAERFGMTDIAYRWAAHDYVSVDSVPYVGRVTRMTPNILTATGFGKWGFSNGAAAAMMIRDAICGRDNPWIGFFDSKRIDPAASLREFVKENVNVAQHYFGDRLPGGSATEVARLREGEGGIVGSGPRKVAVVRENGETRAYSATCTHLGCVVQWNKAERTFDCPCHGSRFDSHGRVFEGPALKDLEETEPPDG